MRPFVSTALCALVAAAGCAAPPGSHGLEAQGLAIALASDDPGHVAAVTQRAVRALADLDLGALGEAAVGEAREEAAAMLGGRYPWVDRDLAALEAAQLDLRRQAEVDFAVEALLDGRMSHAASNQRLPEEPDLAAGKRLYAEVALRIAPWPRGEPYEPHPELLLGQVSVLWYADIAGGSFVARALAAAVLERIAEAVERSTRRRARGGSTGR